MWILKLPIEFSKREDFFPSLNSPVRVGVLVQCENSLRFSIHSQHGAFHFSSRAGDLEQQRNIKHGIFIAFVLFSAFFLCWFGMRMCWSENIRKKCNETLTVLVCWLQFFFKRVHRCRKRCVGMETFEFERDEGIFLSLSSLGFKFKGSFASAKDEALFKWKLSSCLRHSAPQQKAN